MRVKRVVVLVLVLCGGIIPALEVFAPAMVVAGPAVQVRPRMPSGLGAVLVDEDDEVCSGTMMKAKSYNTRGDGDQKTDLTLWFVPGAKKPFLAAEWAAPDYHWPARLLMDLNLNDYADIVSDLANDEDMHEAFGTSPCDALMYYLANKKP